MKTVQLVYFSPTGSTKAVLEAIASGLGMDTTVTNLTRPHGRRNCAYSVQKDLALVGVPVYTERIPDVVRECFAQIRGNGRPALVVCVYGNIHYGIALREVQELCSQCGFKVVAGAAFIARHSFSCSELKVAEERPDSRDKEAARAFGLAVREKLKHGGAELSVLPGRLSLAARIVPANGERLVSFQPVADSSCSSCGICIGACPVGAIKSDTLAIDENLCLRCFACVRVCPVQARVIKLRRKIIVKNYLRLYGRRRRCSYKKLSIYVWITLLLTLLRPSGRLKLLQRGRALSMSRNTMGQPVKFSFFYGWFIVFIAGLGVFFSGPGQTYSVSVFIDSYITEFGWSRSFVSSMYSTGTLFAGMLLPLVGRLVDKRGSRFMVTAIASIFGTACLYMSFVGNPIMLFAGFFLVRLLGQGSMSLVPATLVPQWFVSKRGRALSLMALGGTIASAVLPPLNTWLIDSYGWRFGWQVWAVLLWVVMVPAAWLFIRNRPEDIGLSPDNAQGNGVTRVAAASDLQEADQSWTLREAMRTRAFWLLLFCVTIPSAINTGVTFHLGSIMQSTGFDFGAARIMAAAVLSTLALTQLPFNFVAGFLADKYKVHYLMAIAFAGQLVSLVILLYVRSTTMAIGYGVLWGLLSGFYAINNGVIWPNYFGRRYLGSIRGIAATAMVVGSAFGPLPFGFAYDWFGGYQEIILLVMIFPLGCIAALLSPPPKKQGQVISSPQ